MTERVMARGAEYVDGLLHVERLPVTTLAREFGSPLYIYSASTIRKQFQLLERSVKGLAPETLICYALKANSNLAIGKRLADLGAGADVVSGGELFLAMRMGFSPERIVFAGVGKTKREIAEALAAGIRSFHVESPAEADLLGQVAADMGKVAPLAVRVNPDVDAGTHRHITTGTKANKFGVSPQLALEVIRKAAGSQHVEPVGLHVHIGSQLARVGPILDAVRRVLALWDALASEGIRLRELDIGGGLAIQYRPDDNPEGPEALAAGLKPMLHGRNLQLLLEPGRFLLGPAGVLLTTVLYLKEAGDSRTMAVVDAGMNDLIRPALYDAWHPIWPAQESQQEMGDKFSSSISLVELAAVLARQGYYQEGHATLEKATKLARESGSRFPVVFALTALAQMVSWQLDFELAHEQLDEALALANEVKDGYCTAITFVQMGELARAEHDYTRARSLFEEGLALCRQVQEWEHLAYALFQLGYIMLQRRQLAEAFAYFTESLAIYGKRKEKFGIAMCLTGLVSLESTKRLDEPIANGRLERLAKLLAAAEALMESMGARLFPPEQAEHDQVSAFCKEQLGEQALSIPWAEGRAMTAEQAIAYALHDAEV